MTWGMNRGRLRSWMVVVAAFVGMSSLPAGTAPRQAKKATVAVDLVGVDPMTTKFRNALRARIASDPQLQLTNNVRKADLRLSSRTKIDWRCALRPDGDDLHRDGRIAPRVIQDQRSLLRE